MSGLQRRPADAETLQVRSLHRLLELSRMPLHPPADDTSRRSANSSAPRSSAKIPETGLEVTLRAGRFGPYVQLGEAVEGEKPKRAGLPKGTAPEDVDLERALMLLSLPREVGRHPEDGEPIRAGNGRFGPYVHHGKTYANLEPGDDVFHIGLNRAVTLIAEKVAKGPASPFRRRPGAPARRPSDQGRPDHGQERPLRSYVSHDGVNATLPADKTPESITLEEAAALIDARADRNGPAPHARPRKAKAPFARHRAAHQSFDPNDRARKPRSDHATRKPTTEIHPSCRISRSDGPGHRIRPMSGPMKTDLPSFARRAFEFYSRACRQGRHARDRPRVRRQECRPRGAQADAARTRRRRAHRKAQKAPASRRHVASRRPRRHHRSRQ